MLSRVFTIMGVAAATTMAAQLDLAQYLNQTQEFVNEVRDYSREQLQELAANKREYNQKLIAILQDAEVTLQ